MKSPVKTMAAFVLIVLAVALYGYAQEASEGDKDIGTVVNAPVRVGEHAAEPAEPELSYAHPRLSPDGRWAGILGFIIVPAFFLAAAMIGSLVYSEMPEERPPVAHSHDEPPGGSHHHGPEGTVQPGPEHELPGGHSEHH